MLDPGSIALGLFSGAGGLYVVERYRYRNDLRQRGAAVLGPVFAMLVEADPDRLAINAGPHSGEQLSELWARSSEFDAALQTLATEMPAPGSDHAVELAGAIQRSLNRTGWLVRSILSPAIQPSFNIETSIEDARRAHKEARDLAEALRDDLRRRRPWW